MCTSSPKLSTKHCAFVWLNSSTSCLYIKLTPHCLTIMPELSLSNITLIWLHSLFPSLANQLSRDKYNREMLSPPCIKIGKCLEAQWLWGISPRAITWALIPSFHPISDIDSNAQRANPIHLCASACCSSCIDRAKLSMYLGREFHRRDIS